MTNFHLPMSLWNYIGQEVGVYCTWKITKKKQGRHSAKWGGFIFSNPHSGSKWRKHDHISSKTLKKKNHQIHHKLMTLSGLCNLLLAVIAFSILDVTRGRYLRFLKILIWLQFSWMSTKLCCMLTYLSYIS